MIVYQRVNKKHMKVCHVVPNTRNTLFKDDALLQHYYVSFPNNWGIIAIHQGGHSVDSVKKKSSEKV